MGNQVKEDKVFEALGPRFEKTHSLTEISIAEVNVQLKYIEVHSQHISGYSFKLFPQNLKSLQRNSAAEVEQKCCFVS